MHCFMALYDTNAVSNTQLGMCNVVQINSYTNKSTLYTYYIPENNILTIAWLLMSAYFIALSDW